ncbi:hypothetical protein CAEBREN_11530 [Caenorhabditis brenneri]|uniref:Uncharacterized protein n=1 Tax=Caenorhabditis brenneri TaxID=135651 RepID=G0MJ50_CAEBE|nr:hypothetical protein CAEBREN_11530 [Caenorhabditis brenneri]
MNCHVVVKVAPRGVFELPMKDASFIATKSKMYSTINATVTFLAEVPPSGQMLVRLPTSTMLDIGGIHISGRSDVLELKPVFVAEQRDCDNDCD